MIRQEQKKEQVKRKEGLQSLRLVRLSVVALFLFIVLPFPRAEAGCGCRCYPGICPGDIVQAPLSEGFFAEVIAGFVVVRNYILDGFDSEKDAHLSSGSAIVSSKAAHLRAKEELAGKKIDAMLTTKKLSIQADIAADTYAPSQNAGLACHFLGVDQSLKAMERFSDITRDYIMTGAIAGSKYLGNGPKFSALIKQKICGEVNPGDHTSGNPQDGRDSSCNAVEPPSDPRYEGIVFTDSDINGKMLDPAGPPVRVPEMVDTTITKAGRTITVKVPHAGGDYLKKLWIKIFDQGLNALGPYPAIPYEKELETSKGLTDTAIASGCFVPQTADFESFANMLAYKSRPNCEDPDFTPFCEVVKPLCATANAQNLYLPPSYENCENGLSFYEVEEIFSRMCSSAGTALALVDEGATSSDLKEQAKICGEYNQLWHHKLARKRGNLQQGFDGLIAVRNQCWSDLRS